MGNKLKIRFGTTFDNLILGILLIFLGSITVFSKLPMDFDSYVLKSIGATFIIFGLGINISFKKKTPLTNKEKTQ